MQRQPDPPKVTVYGFAWSHLNDSHLYRNASFVCSVLSSLHDASGLLDTSTKARRRWVCIPFLRSGLLSVWIAMLSVSCFAG